MTGADAQQILPSTGSLEEIFTANAIEGLKQIRNPSPHQRERLATLEASGPLSSHLSLTEAFRLAKKAAWGNYLCAAFSCGLLDGKHGRDLRSRLKGHGDSGFRSAMAECMACWILSSHLGLTVEPRPSGRPGKTLEMVVRLEDGDICVEVKAPIGPGGEYSNLVGRRLEAANKQFSKEGRNILFLVPEFRSLHFTSVFAERRELIKALFGEEVYAIRHRPPGGQVESEGFEFITTGRFLRGRPPRFTRTSAVVCAEESPRQPPDDMRIMHRILVLHNPWARHPVPRHLWKDSPQFPNVAVLLRWTDGHGLLP